MGFVWVCVVCVLCVACVGFCARVELGGFGACGVFAPIFILLPFVFLLCSLSLCLCCPVLVLFPAFPLLSALVPFVGFVIVSFSLSDYTQKERALRVGASSLVCCGLLYLRIAAAFLSATAAALWHS